MTLYIKQRVFSFGDKFSIYDEAGNERYHVEGEVFAFGKKLHLYDHEHRELAFIRQRLMSIPTKFEIMQNGEMTAELVKKFTFFRSEYVVNGPDWKVHGDFSCHNYEVTSYDQRIIRFSKAWFTLGDAYQIDISDSADEILALAIVLAIDAVVDLESNNN